MAKTIDFKNLTRRSLADAVGKSERTIANWLERGLPRKPNQRYDLPSVIDWLISETELKADFPGCESLELERGRKARADLLELDYRQKRGKLVPIEEVENDQFYATRLLRDSLLSLPGRLSDELSVEGDSHRIRMRLTDEISLVFQELADHFKVTNPSEGKNYD